LTVGTVHSPLPRRCRIRRQALRNQNVTSPTLGGGSKHSLPAPDSSFVRVAVAHWTFLCDRTKLKQMGVFFVLAGLILFAIVAGIWGLDSRPGFDGGSSNQVRARRDP